MPNDPSNPKANAAGGLSSHDPLGFTRQVPDRYRILESDDQPVIQCTDAPNLKVRISRDLSIAASAARKAAPGTIFLDGVARCEPFMDHEKQVFNLDHHEGCVRAFTLATCEQALVLSLKGLDLREREWNILANEPDLDTVLAIWILLNHRRLQSREFRLRQRLLTLVRLEGAIDALGLELKEFSGLPPDLLQVMLRLIDHLRREEIRLKNEGLWDSTDFSAYTANLLHQIDRLMLRPSDFSGFQEIKELARADINGKRIAVAVEADKGIYEIEPLLKDIYGDRLGWVILKKGPQTYTLRQMDIFMPVTLDQVYDRLNFIDAAVKYRDRQSNWGGSKEIGGSPREKGTRLTPAEIVNACRDAVQAKGLLWQANRFLGAAALVMVAVAASAVGEYYWPATAWLAGIEPGHVLASPVLGRSLGMLLATLLALVAVAARRPWQYGLALPVGKLWWAFIPLAALGGLAGGRLPQTAGATPEWGLWILGVIVMPVSVELLFRSLAHGYLAQSARIGRPRSPVLFSWPLVGAALLFAAYTLWQTAFGTPLETILETPWPFLQAALGGLALGIVLGLARERSQSILPPMLLHICAAAVALAAARVLF